MFDSSYRSKSSLHKATRQSLKMTKYFHSLAISSILSLVTLANAIRVEHYCDSLLTTAPAAP